MAAVDYPVEFRRFIEAKREIRTPSEWARLKERVSREHRVAIHRASRNRLCQKFFYPQADLLRGGGLGTGVYPQLHLPGWFGHDVWLGFNFSGTEKPTFRGRCPKVYPVTDMDTWRALCLCVPNHSVFVLVDLTYSFENAVFLGVTLKNPRSHTARIVAPCP